MNHQQKLGIIQEKAQKKIVADRLTDPIGESSNHFGKLNQARQKDWLKILQIFWHVGDGKGLSTSKD